MIKHHQGFFWGADFSQDDRNDPLEQPLKMTTIGALADFF